MLAALPDVRSLVMDGVGIGMKPEDLSWLHSGGSGSGSANDENKDDDEEERQQLIDGTRTPPDLRQHAQTLFKDPVALTSLSVSYRSSSDEAFTPSLSLNALTVLLNYLLTTPSVFSLRAEDVKMVGFEGMGDEFAGVIKGFRDALVKAKQEREDWM